MTISIEVIERRTGRAGQQGGRREAEVEVVMAKNALYMPRASPLRARSGSPPGSGRPRGAT